MHLDYDSPEHTKEGYHGLYKIWWFYLDVSNATKKCYDLHANVIFLLAKSVYDITIVSYL